MNFNLPVFSRLASISLLTLLLSATNLVAQQEDTLSTVELKRLTLEELMNIEVASVSKHKESLADAASAIQVITNEDIRKSGAKTLPEALKLAANLQVAQVNSSQWAISARGFNNVLANKLLVLIDGRAVYTPMYAGVFWDVQNVMLEDVERIEVISGPGGTLWGANAVNGVINVITRDASDSQGLFAEVAYGTELRGMTNLRYGGKIAEDLSYRIYATGFKMDAVLDTLGRSAKDDWEMGQIGFRSDWKASPKDHVSLQANLYGGAPNPDGAQHPVIVRGSNVVASWSRAISDKTDFMLQAFYDQTWRDFGSQFTEDLRTYDIEAQNRHMLGRHTLTYGAGFRMMDHDVNNLELFGFYPEQKSLYVSNLFLQYEVMLIAQKLRLTVGTKLEHNTYTDYQHQPNARLTLTPNETQTVWAAVSRAVRNPSRIDRDFAASIAPGVPLIMGSDDFRSETVVAYELGWRTQPRKNVNASVSVFYNEYDNIRSAEPGPSDQGLPISFGNGVRGESYGLEVAARTYLTDWWHMRGGYTLFRKDLEIKPNSGDLNLATAESNDPEHQFVVQSNFDFPYDLSLGAVYRYVSRLPDPYVSAFSGLDIVVGWEIDENIELSVVGQNLLHHDTTEYVADTPPRFIEENIYGRITCRF